MTPRGGPGPARMLGARSVAVVGASDRPDSFGWRMATEALRSPGYERVHLVNPGRTTVLGRPCAASLADLEEPVDLVLLGVPDSALVDNLTLAAARGDGGAVVFGQAVGLRAELVEAAGELPVCGAGCMGFVDNTTGVRAIGYLERESLPVGPIAVVTHSGSVFSTLLRTRRRLHYSVAVSSGQEIVTTTADYLGYALSLPETRVVALVLETIRDAPALLARLAEAADRSVPVVALTVGSSTSGGALVDAHSGAVAGSDAGWEALCAAYGVHRCSDLADLTDSLELFAAGRRPPAGARGIATVHDSGAERVLVADVAERLGVPFAPLSDATTQRLADLVDPGLVPGNPLDLWGVGRSTEQLYGDALATMAADPAVGAVALAVDLVEEYDGDEAFPLALEAVAAATDKPVVALTNLPSAVDGPAAARLRDGGIPVLEGTSSGLRALGHLLAPPPRRRPAPTVDEDRRHRWWGRIGGPLSFVDLARLLADYGVRSAATELVSTREAAAAAAARIGFPVALKAARPEITHKLDVGGVVLGLPDVAAALAAYDALAGRLGPEVQVQRQLPPGVEVSVGAARDPHLGPLLVVATGGSLVELVADRAVALPPVDPGTAEGLWSSLRVAELLAGHRGTAAADTAALTRAVVGVGQLVVELGERLEALDVNPLVVGPEGAVAVDALLVPRR